MIDYEINTGPQDIRATGMDNGSMSAFCVDMFVEPPFVPGEGLKRVLGLSGSIIFDHVSTTEGSTHIYAEVPAGSSNNRYKVEAVVNRLSTYLNDDGSVERDANLESYKTNIL